MARPLSNDADVLRQFAASIDESALDQIAAAMVGSIFEGVPAVAADTDLRAEQEAAVKAAARGFLTTFETEPWVSPKMLTALGDVARTMASRGLDITVFIKTTRQAQSVYWPALMTLAEEKLPDSKVRMRVLGLAFRRFSQFIESQLDGAITEFQSERDRLMRGATARRNETIRALLEGDDDINMNTASQTLAYALRQHHTALALSERSGRPGALDRLETFAREVTATLHRASTLMVPSGPHGLWVWIATPNPLSAVDCARLRGLSVPQDILVAIGQTSQGRAGFTQSHEQARAAQRIVDIAGTAENVVWYEDIEIVSLLSQDAKGARALTRRELAALSESTVVAAKLRATTLAYLRNACSATGAARELGLHKNTVRYRITQVEDVLGRRLGGQELRLQLALMLVETLGQEMLSHAEGQVPAGPARA